MSDADRTPPTEVLGPVIHRYTRAQALADGVLVDVSASAREAGLRWPVALTAAAWADCVAWSEADSRRKTYQDEAGRLWDVLVMAAHAIRHARGNAAQLSYALYRIPRQGERLHPEQVTLKLVAGPGDHGEPVLTVMLPHED
jgi:hypothetical protein